MNLFAGSENEEMDFEKPTTKSPSVDDSKWESLLFDCLYERKYHDISATANRNMLIIFTTKALLSLSLSHLKSIVDGRVAS